MILRPFLKCGISNSLDGIKNELVQCIWKFSWEFCWWSWLFVYLRIVMSDDEESDNEGFWHLMRELICCNCSCENEQTGDQVVRMSWCFRRTGNQVIQTSWCFQWTGDQVVRTSWYFQRTGDQVIEMSWCFQQKGDQVIQTNGSFYRMDDNAVRTGAIVFEQLTNGCKRNPI